MQSKTYDYFIKAVYGGQIISGCKVRSQKSIGA